MRAPAAPNTCILTTNYEPKSRSRRTGDQFEEKIVIVRGALKRVEDLNIYNIGAQGIVGVGATIPMST